MNHAPRKLYRDVTQFKKFIVAGSIWMAVGLILPDIRGVNYVLGAILCLVFMWRNTRDLQDDARSVARVLVLAGGLSLAGVIGRVIHGAIVGQEFPFPSPADALTLLTYPVFIFAILRIVKQRVGYITIDLTIDALVAGAAAAVVQWTLLIRPILQMTKMSNSDKVLHVTYGLMGLALFMAAICLLVAGSHRSTSNRLLGAALALVF
ncbi:MAG: hypothetical protein KDB26_15490, partial [Microthrixaceae bacterium]|nr:hypothetical protein [Microthrixaceae bacterium]